MNNYEYIIASLPVLQPDGRENLDCGAILEEIRERLDGRDAESLDFLLSGFDGEGLDADFYRRAGRQRSRFLREYFAYDRLARNTKVEFLNRSLGRPEGTDLVLLNEDEDLHPDGREELDAVLGQEDILGRERGLDGLMWRKIDEITVMDVFSLDLILGFAAKLRITGRWLQLDEGTGRELFRKLVKEIKENYKTI